jgi:hypothetical protein
LLAVTRDSVEKSLTCYWYVDHFIQTGEAWALLNRGIRYEPSTHHDFDALIRERSLVLPSQMTQAWFMNTLQCLAGEKGKTVDFSWA